MTAPARKPSREHDLRMHLGTILMALQMLTRPPTEPLTPDQQELLDIIQRAAKSLQGILDTPPDPEPVSSTPGQHRRRKGDLPAKD
jgi:hypothetical protein